MLTNKIMNKGLILLLTWALVTQLAWGGAFLGSNISKFGDIATDPTSITHPPGYDGTGGQLLVTLCIDPNSEDISPAMVSIQNAAITWNGLEATTGNTFGGSSNDIPDATTVVDFETVLLHELGHPLGLDHGNIGDFERATVTPTTRDYTAAQRGPNGRFNFIRGADGVIGTEDDRRGDDINRHWFRTVDNNPFLIGDIVDQTTYSVDIANLPGNDSFPTNALLINSNRLGVPQTEAVMHTSTLVDEAQRTLTADDVSMVRLSNAGLDEIQGTADDYRVFVDFIGVNENCDVKIIITEFAPQTNFSRITLENIPGSNHTVVAAGAEMEIRSSAGVNWYFNQVELEAVEPPPPPPPVVDNPTGSWFNPERNGEGWVIEKFNDDVAVFYWFTYPPEGVEGRQLWLLGVGDIVGNRFVFDGVQITSGAIFGDNFNPDDVVREPWGSIEFEFTDDDTGVISYSGPEAFGSGSFNMERFVELDPDAETTRLPAGISGSWFDPTTDGEGWVIEVINSTQAVVYWFTYDENGNQAWNVGVAQIVDNTLVLEDSADTSGTVFGEGFDATAVQRSFFGTLLFEFDDCGSGTLSFTSVRGDGTRNIQRITSIQDFECEAF